MKKVILGIAALIILGVGGLFMYVSMVDWNTHKEKISTQFSNVTGKDIVFGGNVNFRVFPSPSLTADNVRIYDKNRQTNPNPLATIKSMQVDLALLPLVHGNFDVKRMVIVEPEMLIEILPEGKINWQSPLNYDNDQNIDVVLDSVTIERATLKIVSREDNIDIRLDNLNAEIVADSIFGPYRIEGTYMKNNNPEGFAVSLGTFSDSFATSLNFVITHPRSNSTLHFDGSFFLKNSAVNGSMMLESAKISEFVNSYFNFDLSSDFDYPLSLSMEINTNRQKIDISNFVVKYGDTVGAGNVLIPLRNKEYNYSDEVEEVRRKIEVGFNMTDLDLRPVVKAIRKISSRYSDMQKSFSFDLGYDVLFDLKSVKTTYREQNIRDFKVSIDILENAININSIGGIFPGETSFTTKGKIFSLDEVLTYNFDVSANTIDVLQLSKWLGHEIAPLNQFTYRNAVLTTNVSGNMRNVKVSPFEAVFDKTAMSGEAGFVFGEKISALLNLKIDTINFDNYIDKMPSEFEAKALDEKVEYWVSKILFLKDMDLQFDGTLDLGIYSATPFENTNLVFNLSDNLFNIENLSIASVRNSSLEVKGEVDAFGEIFSFSNIKYGISSQNFYSIFSEETLPLLLRGAKDLKKIDIKGLMSGNLNRVNTKKVIKLDNIDFAYSGIIEKTSANYMFDGKVELRAPDFLKFVNRFNMNYSPRVISMGIFKLSADFKGIVDNFTLNNLDAYIGSNRFIGTVSYNNMVEIPTITAELDINKFELDRFIYNVNKGSETPGSFSLVAEGNADFIAKPYLDKIKIDYTPYQKVKVDGKINIGTISYKNQQINNAGFIITINEAGINVADFKGAYLGGNIEGSFNISTHGDNLIRANISAKDLSIYDYLVGAKYGVKSEKLSLQADVSSTASSIHSLFTAMSGNMKFAFSDPTIVGWYLGAIEQDLRTRTLGEGLQSFVMENLQTGQTSFNNFSGNIVLDKGIYRISDGFMDGVAYEVKMTGEGNIDLWDMKTNYVVTFLDIKSTPTFNFSLNGPISSPNLSVDVSPIVNVYEENQRKLEEDKQKAALEKLDKLSFLMGEEYDRAVVTEKQVAKMIELVSNRIKVVTNEPILNEYESIMTSLEKMKEDIDFVIRVSTEPEETFTEENINKSKEINDKIDREVLLVQSRIDNIYIQDIRDIVSDKYNELAGRYRKSRQMIVDYRDIYVQYPRRLAIIDQSSLIDNDAKVAEMKENIESAFLRLDARNNEGGKDYIIIQTINDSEELKKYEDKIDGILAEYDADELQMKNDIAELLRYLEELTTQGEVEYDKMVEEERIKQKIEENKGKISTSLGRSVTVVRDIEEIEKSEEIKQKENIPVLDFSKSSSSSKKVVPSVKKVLSREEIEEKISNDNKGIVLKKIEGEISGATGLISKE